jgi:hypothetical protein
MLKSFVYVSSATRLMTQPELTELLRQARQNNARDQITGMLLYKDGNFMQAFEGEEEKVTRLHDKILTDPRHRNIITLLRESLEERRFGIWSMAFQNVDLLGEDERASFSPFLSQPFAKDYFGDTPNNAIKLLLSFRKSYERC